MPFGGLQSGLAVFCCFPVIALIPRCQKPLLRLLKGLKFKQIRKGEKQFANSIHPPKDSNELSRYPFVPLGLEMIFVLCRFVGFWFCLRAFSITAQITFGQGLAAFAIAWTVGLIVPAAPGGLGVFEAAIFLRLGAVLPEASFLAAIVTYRVVSTLADLLAVLFLPNRLSRFKSFKGNSLLIKDP